MLPIYLISQMTLEEWGPLKTWDEGVGGSETSHLECSFRLANRGYNVTSYCPLSGGWHDTEYKGVHWYDVRKMAPLPDEPAIIINYRHPKLFDGPKNSKHKYWFIAQDVDYENQWTEQAQKNCDRFLALCKTHADYTLAKYPLLRDKVFISTNGIRTDYINKLPPLERQPHRMFWASSPDRGLLLLLENWFRIRERFPKAELRIAYGFNNMDTIIKYQGGRTPLLQLREQLMSLKDQPGLTWLGRLTQDKVFQEWQQASVFPYCSDWPETSCISIMEAMACGAIPVTTNFWAQGEHATAAPLAYVVDGLPQKSELVKCLWLENLYEALSGDFDTTGIFGNYAAMELSQGEFTSVMVGKVGDGLLRGTSREQLQQWARTRYDWDAVIQQWEGWLKLDMKSPKLNKKLKKKGKK